MMMIVSLAWRRRCPFPSFSLLDELRRTGRRGSCREAHWHRVQKFSGKGEEHRHTGRWDMAASGVGWTWGGSSDDDVLGFLCVWMGGQQGGTLEGRRDGETG
ncbi:hypothetical protein CCHR01_03009 [Colletotrichum chrysophilum]|uniref:Uncharacterized protein n=1 Tax=Colletotrichum chrysophilum TaxID=1836956 RepID=A0AAD9EN39_9PEZI|nr:hypothetical protein K456DRAFT_163679 [Colletotrichum gloeosporioides 23]KAK1854388.1 hypothetical protein CCHR01_03009 [Colletotrichum chrysophilum]